MFLSLQITQALGLSVKHVRRYFFKNLMFKIKLEADLTINDIRELIWVCDDDNKEKWRLRLNCGENEVKLGYKCKLFWH